MFLGLLLVVLQLNCYCIAVPAGLFTAKCLERHFWLSIKASLLGSTIQFNVEDGSGLHFLSAPIAAECGYTWKLNHHGDLVFRASFLACYVDNWRDTEFRVRVWLLNMQTNRSVDAYPFMLHCSLTEQWNQREMVCDENYMEVSLGWQIPVVLPHGLKWPNLQSKIVKYKVEQLRLGHVIFFTPTDGKKGPLTIKKAEALGYRIVATDSRILLRSAYSSKFSFTFKDGDVQVEAVNAAIILQIQGTSIPFDISVACTMSSAIF